VWSAPIVILLSFFQCFTGITQGTKQRLIEDKRAKDHSYKNYVQLSALPLAQQIVELLQHVNLEDKDGVLLDQHEILMHSCLFPIGRDAKEFRD